jgi:hypothetical protein
MQRRVLVRAFAAAALATVSLAAPALAHGGHDARPLARHVAVGPYIVSLWQVYPDAGDAMEPRLIVLFETGAAGLSAGVRVTSNAIPLDVRPSTATPYGWESTEGVTEGDVLAVTISDGRRSWSLEPVVVASVATSRLPMQVLITISIVLTAMTAFWVLGRTARAWRRPIPSPT